MKCTIISRIGDLKELLVVRVAPTPKEEHADQVRCACCCHPDKVPSPTATQPESSCENPNPCCQKEEPSEKAETAISLGMENIRKEAYTDFKYKFLKAFLYYANTPIIRPTDKDMNLITAIAELLLNDAPLDKIIRNYLSNTLPTYKKDPTVTDMFLSDVNDAFSTLTAVYGYGEDDVSADASDAITTDLVYDKVRAMSASCFASLRYDATKDLYEKISMCQLLVDSPQACAPSELREELNHMMHEVTTTIANKGTIHNISCPTKYHTGGAVGWNIAASTLFILLSEAYNREGNKFDKHYMKAAASLAYYMSLHNIEFAWSTYKKGVKVVRGNLYGNYNDIIDDDDDDDSVSGSFYNLLTRILDAAQSHR